MTHRISLVLALFALAACDRNGEADLGPHCQDTPTAVALTDATDLGFTGAEVTALAEGSWSETLTWTAGGTTPLTLTVGAATAARFVESVAVYPPGSEQTDIGVDCSDRVEIDAPLTFATDDGAFADSVVATLRSEDGVVSKLFEELDPFELDGTFDITSHITEPDYDEVRLWLDGTFDGTATQGQVGGQVSGEEECDGNTCTAWASELDIASW